MEEVSSIYIAINIATSPINLVNRKNFEFLKTIHSQVNLVASFQNLMLNEVKLYSLNQFY